MEDRERRENKEKALPYQLFGYNISVLSNKEKEQNGSNERRKMNVCETEKKKIIENDEKRKENCYYASVSP